MKRVRHDRDWHTEMMQQVMKERERGLDCTRHKRENMRAFDRLPQTFRDVINELGPEAPEHVNERWMSML